MAEETDSRKGGSEPACFWCGKPLPPHEGDPERERVCERCVRLLRDAGLPDEEIFRREPAD
jgi:hypothetical protein